MTLKHGLLVRTFFLYGRVAGDTAQGFMTLTRRTILTMVMMWFSNLEK